MEEKEKIEQSEEQENWKEIEKKLGISFSDSPSLKEIKTVRIGNLTWTKLNEKRGHNGCRTFEDVIKNLLDNDNKVI
ncbi:hypothetical protein LCGC14_2351380 [marine sediment metagenome]|uniref:Uncharacterized protein n=1 Tax=marine sediment metagenome TaxID=412755 RepID=A0A0F9ELU4_9ZZZZ